MEVVDEFEDAGSGVLGADGHVVPEIRLRLLAKVDRQRNAATKATLSYALDAWLEVHEADDSTLDRYRELADRTIGPALGDVPIPSSEPGGDRPAARHRGGQHGRRFVVRQRTRRARRIRPGSLIAGFPHTVGRGARTVRFVDGTNRDGSLAVRQLGWVPVTVTSARLITPALVAGDCTLT
ncbi:hypothetical protein [Kribbella sp. VKM Ac-2566]|uniref:hypothetical protein n=1 Tax=Kribbella sp. VKM Ac-2566 TaxID=2512218 RepID=UPI001416FEE8|nr:hypothetical protein [Kribbella sp. VKM Ac-2566]